MVQLSIHFGLLPDKLNEFTLSWESFCQHIQTTGGLSKWSFNQIKENNFEIVLLCEDQQCLDNFIEKEWYQFLHGAIEVLGETRSINTETNTVQ